MTDTGMNPCDAFPAGFSEAYFPDVINGWCVLMDFGSEVLPVSVGFVTLGRNHGTGIPFVFRKKKRADPFCLLLNLLFRRSDLPPFVISTYRRAREIPTTTRYFPQILEDRYHPRAGDRLLVLDWGKSKQHGGLSGDILAFGACSVGLDPSVGVPLVFGSGGFVLEVKKKVKDAYKDLPISDRKWWGAPRGKWKVILPTTQLLYG